jgi:hypothetical protein
MVYSEKEEDMRVKYRMMTGFMLCRMMDPYMGMGALGWSRGPPSD